MRENPTATQRLGLAQPILGAGTLTFFSLLLALPLLALLNRVLPPTLAPSELMASFAVGQLYNAAASWFDAPVAALMLQTAGLSVSGALISLLAFACLLLICLAWIIALGLLGLWRLQLPMVERLGPLRFLLAVVVSALLLGALFWLGRQGGDALAEAQGLGLAILHFFLGYLIILMWFYAIAGSFVSWRSLLMTAFTVSFLITLYTWGFGAAIPEQLDDPRGLLALVLAHLFGFWFLLLLGVYFLARETLGQAEWRDLNTLSRGQQVDFGLAILTLLGDPARPNRWMSGQAIAQRLGAQHALSVQALKRLYEADLVRTSTAMGQSDQWCLATESLQGLSLHDLIEAFDATLDPSDGVYSQGPQPALVALAQQERRVLRSDLSSVTRASLTRASLTRMGMDPALGTEAPAFLTHLHDPASGGQEAGDEALLPVSTASQTYARLTALLAREAATDPGAKAAKAAQSSQVTQGFPAFNLPTSTPPTSAAASRPAAKGRRLESPRQSP